ncbi:MAG: hypothetical protein AB7U20_07015 [Planctomycetaceae bacterium]
MCGRLVLAGVIFMHGAGCHEPAQDSADSGSSSSANDGQPPGAAPDRIADAAESSRNAKDPRSKWVGDIPYDVFFDDPLAVVADDRVATPSDRPAPLVAPVLEPSSPRADANGRSTPQAASDSTPAPRGAVAPVDWEELAEIEVLNEEVKQIRTRLSASLRTVATYNRNVEAIAGDAVILAAIAAVVQVHPGSLSWQEKAGGVRNLALELASHASGTGRQAFSAAQLPYEQLVGVLDGGTLPDGGADDQRPFSDVAGRTDLMRRIKRAFDWLKSEVNTEDRFRASREQIIREASLLAVCGGLVSTESYDLSDEPRYQQFVRELMNGGKGMASAVASESYPDFTTARDRVQNSCAACHGEYALGDEGL